MIFVTLLIQYLLLFIKVQVREDVRFKIKSGLTPTAPLQPTDVRIVQFVDQSLNRLASSEVEFIIF